MEPTQNVTDRFPLPDEILNVIPTDPHDQLDLARKLTSMAIASRVSQLEAETERLQRKAAEKDMMVVELRGRVERLERIFQEADDHLRASLEENVKLFEEREVLILTTKKLSRELAKLEAFKRNLMNSLSEDNLPHGETAETVIGVLSTSEYSFWKDDRSIDHTSNVITALIDDTNQKGNIGQRFSITPYISPQLTPAGTPDVASSGLSHKAFSAITSPKGSSAASSESSSGTTSPLRPSTKQSSLTSGHRTRIQQSLAVWSSATGQKASGLATHADGKEFFRLARNCLSYDQFGAFLINIKEFNARRQSLEETLVKAGEIFGTNNEDLYLSFKRLLYPNLR